MTVISVLHRMKLAEEGFAYHEDPRQQQADELKAKVLKAGLLAAGAGYVGGKIGRQMGQSEVIKHLSDDANLAHFATRGGQRKFKAGPGVGLTIGKKIKFSRSK